MNQSATIGGVSYVWSEPGNAASVLEWDLRIRACQDEPSVFVVRAADWAAEHVISVGGQYLGHAATAKRLAQMGRADTEGLTSLVLLCHRVAQTAKLPDEFVVGLRTLWARDAEVEEDKPAPWCECPRCTGDNPGAPESVCKFRGISDAVLETAGKLLGVDEAGAILSQPYWLLQLQAERARIRSRLMNQADKQRKAVSETVDMWDEHGPAGWRDRVH